jgi:hypothetical protein
MKKNRIPWGKEPFIKEEKLSREQFEENYGMCHDCGAKYGEIHDYGCDMEECPVCHGQFMGCTEKCIDKLDNDEQNELLNKQKEKKLHEVKPWDIDFKISNPFGGDKTNKKGKYILPGGEYWL